MDDKTASLRDIFMEVTDDETVTERQEESPGTLTGDQPVDDRLDALIARLRERYDFTTPLDSTTLRTVAHEFYDDRGDADIATDLAVETAIVRQARFDLHLVTPEDIEGPIPYRELREAVKSEQDAEQLASDHNTTTKAVDRQLAAARAEDAMRRASYRFRDEFDEILGDGDVAEHMGTDVKDDGLADATEGLEVETSF